MPTGSSRRHRHHDEVGYGHGRGGDKDRDSGRGRGRGRDQSRPRVLRRKSTHDDKYDKRPRRSRRYNGDDYDYDSEPGSEYDDYDSPQPRRRHTRSEGRGRSSNRNLDREYEEEEEEFQRQKRDQAVKSALTAGAVEAIRQRNRPGDWVGERGFRVATAALSAAAIDTAVDKDPTRKRKRNLVKSTIGGLLVDRLASGVRGRR